MGPDGWRRAPLRSLSEEEEREEQQEQRRTSPFSLVAVVAGRDEEMVEEKGCE